MLEGGGRKGGKCTEARGEKRGWGEIRVLVASSFSREERVDYTDML